MIKRAESRIPTYRRKRRRGWFGRLVRWLVLTAFGLVLMPAQNALSRFFERQCDRYALRRTQAADAYRSAFLKLARINKSDR